MLTLKRSFPGIVMIIISLIILYQAILIQGTELMNPAGGGFLPAVISAILIICGLLTIRTDLRPKPQSNDETEPADDPLTKDDYKLILSYFLFIVLYVVSLSFIPFFISTILFLIISIYQLKGIRWYTNVIVSTSTVLIIYFLFSQLFNIVFP